MITNNDKGGKKIVTSGNIFDAEIVKDTKSITLRKNKLSKSVIEAKIPNALETRAVEKESTILGLLKTMKTSKEDFKKQLLEQREGTSGLKVKLKMEIDSGTKRKILIKENKNEVTRLQESAVMSKSIEKEKGIMRSWLKEDIIGNETSQEEYEKQVILQRHENTDSSIVLGNKTKVLSKEKQNEITRLNESRVFSEIILERVNTTFQHKHKPKEASVNDNITHIIVENSNASDSNVIMIRKDDK